VLVQRVLSASVIFNLALVCHLQAVQGRVEFYRKAQQLYASVLKLLDKLVIEFFPEALTMRLASMNNLSQTCLEMGDNSHAARILASLHQCLMLRIFSSSDERRILTEDDWRRIGTNVYSLLYRGGQSVTAPAA
jgi:hypothetical protein